MAKNFSQKNDIIKQRILQYVEHKQLVKTEFYQKIDVVASTFGGSALQNALSSRTIVQILTLFPDLSAEWLLRGKGQMIIEEKPQIQTNEELIMENNYLKRIVEIQKKLIAKLEEQ
jgi:hypothetical protein